MTDDQKTTVVRQPAEVRFAAELSFLAASDDAPRPQGWQLSARAVRTFIIGSGGKKLKGQGRRKLAISRKFYGDDQLVDRCIVTLMGSRGLLLVGEPGTAKTMLSELLAAAICGSSVNTIQGTAGTTEDQIKYSWNYALLLSEGPSPRALVPSPLYIALQRGSIARFEEITRCSPESQDTMVSILSDKMLHVPELGEEHALVLAQKGFNVIATANIRDRGVNEMSTALKRRFNFETVYPLSDKKLEVELVRRQSDLDLQEAQVPAEIPLDVIDVLVTTFQDLRGGRTEEGTVVEKPGTVMSTAEAVSVTSAAALDAYYLGDGKVRGENLVRQLLGTVVKDNPDDAKKIRHYFDVVVKARARRSKRWKELYQARKLLGK